MTERLSIQIFGLQQMRLSAMPYDQSARSKALAALAETEQRIRSAIREEFKGDPDGERQALVSAEL